MRARRLTGLALWAGVLVLAGCGTGGGGQPDAGAVCSINGVALSGSPASVGPGQMVNLTATVTQASGSSGCNGGVVWAVNPNGGGLTASGLTATLVSFLPAVTGKPWGSIHGYNVQSLVELHHTGLVQAGADSPFTANSAIAVVGPGLNATPVAVLNVDHVAIDHPVGGGVFLDSMAAFTSDSTWLGIVGAQDHPLALHLMAAGTIPQMIVQDDPAQTKHFTDARIFTTAPNITQDTTINGNIPLYLENNVNVVQTGSIITPLGVTLTVLPGAELRFKPGADLRMVFGGRGNPAGNPVGRLIALGTPTSPIRFTSAAAAPAAGDWAGIQMPAATGSQMAFNIIEYAGGFSGVVSANCRPQGSSDNAALIVGGPDFTPSGSMIVSSMIQFSAGHGIDATWQAGTPNDPNLADSANFNVFTAIGGCKQTYNGLVPGVGSCPTGGGCTEQ